jgi:hypothetical protein
MTHTTYESRRRSIAKALRESRENPEIEEILNVIHKNSKELLAEKEYTARIGRARVMIALLEQLEDEPERTPADIEPGPAGERRQGLTPRDFDNKGPEFTDETPFDTPGPAEGQFFFYTSSGLFSNLYTKGPLDPYYVTPLHSHGPFVYTMEKRNATIVKTAMRFSSTEAIERALSMIQPAGLMNAGYHYLICHHLGFYNGSIAPKVAAFESLESAFQAGEIFSQVSDIRFVTATQRASFCTR